MKKNVLIAAILLLLNLMVFVSCSNKKKELEIKITQKVDSTLTKHVHFIVSSIPYLCYCIPTNYWYPDGTTSQEVLDDNFDRGLDGLSRLENRVKEIDYSFSTKVDEKIDSLLIIVKKHKNNIKHILEVKNSLFGMLLFSTADLFGSLEGSPKDEDEAPMPEDIVNAMNDLEEVLTDYYKNALNIKLLRIEKNSFEQLEYPLLQDKDRLEIREYLISSFENKIRTEASDKCDSSCIEIILSSLIDPTPPTFLISEINRLVEESISINKSDLSKLSKKETKLLKRALIYEFSIDPRVYEDDEHLSLYQYFTIDKFSTFTFNNKPLIQINYSCGTGSSNTILYYYFDNGVFTSITNLDADENISSIMNEYIIVNINILGIKEISGNELVFKGSGFLQDDANCCPTYDLSIIGSLNRNSIILQKINLLQKK